MPPPTNIDGPSATDLGTLPAHVTQDVNDAGTTYDVVYKFTAAATGLVSIFAYGDPAIYRPVVRVADNDALSPAITFAQNVPIQIAVTAGATYWFKATSGNVDPAILTVDVEYLAPVPIALGDIAVPDDAGPFPLVVLSAETGAVIGYTPGFPPGEFGDVLASGEILVENNEAETLELWSAAREFVATLTGWSSESVSIVRTCHGLGVWIVGHPGGGATHAQYATVAADGTVSGSVSFPAAGLTAIALSNDGATVYLAGQAVSNSAIKQWDTAGATMGSDLAAVVASYNCTDLLVLADDSIVALYMQISSPHATFARRYDPAGTLLNTYTLGNDDGTNPKLAYALDDPTSFWAWIHRSDEDGSTSDFFNIDAATGSNLTALTGLPVFEGASYQGPEADPDSPRFGHSFSCPFFLLREPTPEAVIGPIVWVNWPRVTP